MTRTSRKPLTAADARRMGGQPLDLRIGRTWLEYAVHRTGDEKTGIAIDAALKAEGDPLPINLTYSQAEALAAACEAGGRTRTAEAIRDALERALKPAELTDPLDHLQMLADLGELEPDELEMLRGAMGKRDSGGLF